MRTTFLAIAAATAALATVPALAERADRAKEIVIVADKGTGEIVFDEAPMPAISEFRLIAVMADGPADNEWLVGRGFPRVKLSTIPEEAWKPEDPVKFDLEFSVFTDNMIGTPCRHYVGGTGAVRSLDAIGFEKAV